MPTASLDDAVMCAQWRHEVRAITQRAASSSRALASAAVAAAGGLSAAVDAGPRHVVEGDAAPPSPRLQQRAEEGWAAYTPQAAPGARLGDTALDDAAAAPDSEATSDRPAPAPAPTVAPAPAPAPAPMPSPTPTPEGEAELSAEKGEEAEAEPSSFVTHTPPRRRRTGGASAREDGPTGWRLPSSSSSSPVAHRTGAAVSPRAHPSLVAAGPPRSPARTPRRVDVRRGYMPRYPTSADPHASGEGGPPSRGGEGEGDAAVRSALSRVRARVEACTFRPPLQPIATSVSALPAAAAAPASNSSAPPYLTDAVDVLPLENCDVTMHRSYRATPHVRGGAGAAGAAAPRLQQPPLLCGKALTPPCVARRGCPQVRVDRPVLELAQARRTLRLRAHSSQELEVWRIGLSRNAAACSSVNYMRLSDVMIGDEVGRPRPPRAAPT